MLAPQDVTKDYSTVYVCGAHVQMPITTAERAWHVVAPMRVCVWCMYALIQHPTVTLCIYALCSPVQARCPWGTAVEMVMEQQQC